MGEVFQDREALHELFELAKADEHKEDISYSLKSLFDTKENPVSRKRSAIVNAFYQNAANHRVSDKDLDLQELIDFINAHDITMLAPYMVGYFHPDSISELTVSWWTQEFEDENMKKYENWTGQTKARRIPFKKDSPDVNIASESHDDEWFLVDDDWADKNPTIVLGSFFQSESNLKAKVNNTSSRISGAPVMLCDQTNRSTQNIVVKMPGFRLEKNVAPWPKDNFIYLWVGFAEGVTFGTNGLPTITPSVNLVMSGQKITRREANIQRWITVQSAFIVSNWNPQSDNIYLVWGYEKRNSTIDFSGALKATKDGVSAENTFKIAQRDEIQIMSALSFDKCYTIRNNVLGIDQGWGFYGSTLFPKYPFGEIRTYFTLETL
jgi:hypothetical protein